MVISDAIADEGWIEHDGASVPCTAQGLTEVILRDRRQTYDRFGFWLWDRANRMALDIVAYRPNGQSSMRLAA